MTVARWQMPEHFVHLVRDIDDRRRRRAASRSMTCDEALEFARRQARRRLVHGDDLRLVEQRAGDLDDLPLRDLQAAEIGADGSIDGSSRRKGFGGAALLLARD